MNRQLLREIPKVDFLLNLPTIVLACEENATQTVTAVIRTTLDKLRHDILDGTVTAIPELPDLCTTILNGVSGANLPSLRSVINATGVVLHTNLGRACLAPEAVEAVCQVAQGYSTLEYDVEGGCRGHRYTHVESLVASLTGAESTLVVNNNAAAVLLILSTLASGGEVITSRGELVEIGGSFRIPEIMESCGCQLREVGATNKTHLRDYEKAINADTRALLKVHTSNYKIAGFTQSVPLHELAQLAHNKDLLLIEDLGSGSLFDLEQLGLHDEPTVQHSVASGVDIVCFSGDKLLGGPQAGIIIGKKKWIDILKQHPLTRAMRVDKMTLAALEATLRIYVQGREREAIPTLAMLSASKEILLQRAQTLCAQIQNVNITAEVIEETDQVGGGSVPTQLLPTYAVAISPTHISVADLERAMRIRPRPIIGRIARNRYLLDLRTINTIDFPYLVSTLQEVLL